jgi:uncharacterized protein (TIGR04255 family)
MYEQICYKKSFLKQVIARIDFASPIAQLEKAVPAKILNAIVKYFPVVEPADVLMQEIAFDAAGVKHSQVASKQWNYFSKDRALQLTLAAQNVFVVYNSYNKYEDIRDQFSTVVDVLSKTFPETKAARFGIRYINQIDMAMDDPTSWDQYIEPRLLTSRSFFGEGDAITRLITISEIKYDDMNVVFQYGMPNPDHPAQIKRPLFILDLDASVAQAHELAETLVYMDAGHSRIQAIFERSITDALREKMDAKPIQ